MDTGAPTPGEGPHEKKVPWLLCLLLIPGLPCAGQQGGPNVHEQASACKEDYVAETCDEVCETCHLSSSGGGNFTVTVDGEFPGFYGAAAQEDPWLLLSPEHQSCRECHATYAEETGNHPIFIAGGDPFSTEESTTLKYFDGKILCATCHDPHSAAGGLLRIENANSALCQECHRY